MKKILLLCLAGLLAGCSEPPVVEKPPRAVLVQSLGNVPTLAAPSVYTGEVRARFEADLGFRIGGKIVSRPVDVGTRVARGQELARLDPQDVELAAAAARAQVAAAEADARLARAELERGQSLHERNFISASALDGHRTALEAAEARLRQARAEAATAGHQTGYATLTADHDGVVTAAVAEVGQVVAAGQPVLRVARPEEREILIHVPESRVRALGEGTPGQVRPWSDARRGYAGSVREIAPAADAATRTYAVRVAVPNADDNLPLGATASVAFAGEDAGQALLPLPAVTRADGRATVWVVDEHSRVQPLPVETGAFREDGVVIRSGLPDKARVVIAGVHRLVAGETVRAVEASAPIALDAAR